MGHFRSDHGGVLSAEREKALTEQIRQQWIQIEGLTASIRSLEEALLSKKGHIQALTGKNLGLSKLISNKSEKMTAPAGSGQELLPNQWTRK